MIRNTCAWRRAALTAMLCLAMWLPAGAQGLQQPIKGELKSGKPELFSDYMVQVVDPTHRQNFSRVEVRNDGSFELRNVTPGEYSIVVTTLHGDVVMEQNVSVNPHSPLELRFPEKRDQRLAGRTISMKQLLHPPSKKAFHSFVEAQKYSSAGDYQKAVQALERAVEESPDYAEAHVNLGVQYIRTGHLEQAAAELQRALDISGPNAIALADLAWVQVRLGKPDQAIASAREAVKLDQGSATGHLILGTLLANYPNTRQEGIAHLEKAAVTLDSAKEMLAKLR